MDYIIYGLFDMSDEIPCYRYIGFTSKGIKERLTEHIVERDRFSTHKNKWIKKVMASGSSVSIEIIESVDEVTWQEREKFWIKHYGRSNLTNGTDGGEGLLNPSLELRQKCSERMSKSLIGNTYRKGKKHSDEVKKKISISLANSEKFVQGMKNRKSRVGCIHSAETKAKVSAAKKGKPHPRTKEWTAKIALANTGNKQSDATKKKRLPSLIGNTRGLGSKRSDEFKSKLSLKKTGSKRFNNGVVSIYVMHGSPVPEGFVSGALPTKGLL